jgi:hypothetical protein
MEICSKLPAENCGISDWVKLGAGTTALPSRSVSNITPLTAPRYIDPADERFPRRVSFLRYDDIYADGNQSLVIVQACPNGAATWPIPIGVTNGNAATGYTYPQPLGDLSVPYRTSSRNSYGDIACPPLAGARLDIRTNNFTANEGRPRTLTTGLPKLMLAINSGNYTAANVVATNNQTDTLAAYAEYRFIVRVRDRTNAPGTVSANINVINGATATATLGATGGTIANNTANNASQVDVINQVYAYGTGANACLTSAGVTIARGTPITQVFFPNTTPATQQCEVAVLVARDIMDEPNENFRLQIASPANSVIVAGGDIRTGTIGQIQTGINVVGTPTIITIPQCPAGSSTNADTNIVGSFTGTDDGLLQDVNRVTTNRPSNCTPTPTPTPTPIPTLTPTPTPIPTPTPTPGGGVTMLHPSVFGLLHPHSLSIRYSGLPGAAMLPSLNTSIAAAYPTTGATYLPASCPTTVVDGSYVCSSAAAAIPPVRFSGNSIFGAGRQVPPKPNDPSGTVDGFAPMLPGMSQTRPANSPRALWFRTAGSNSNYIGEGDNVNYQSDRNLFIYNQSWPSIGGGGGGTGGNRGNLNTTRLVLPDTVCIDTSDGSVDALCTKQTGAFGTTTPSANLINLNLPLNPHYPSNASSASGVSGTKPASTYAVCGINGASQNYQSSEIAPQSDITGGNCPTDPRAAIATAMGTTANGFQNNNLNPENADFRGQGSVVPGFVSPPPIVTGIDSGNRLITVDATNTHEINKVNVINLTGLDAPLTATASSLPWNEACPATEQGTAKTISGTLRLRANPNQPSPVFILRSCPFQDLALDNFKLQLDGVEPNNVFWVIPRVTPTIATASRALTIGNTLATDSTVVSGNFLGIMPATGVGDRLNTTTLNITNSAVSPAGINVALRSTRFLGFRSFSAGATSAPNPASELSDGIDSQALVAAMTTTNQPIVLPVLQIHSPTALTAGGGQNLPQPDFSVPAPVNNSMTGNTDSNTSTGQWVQRATDSEINVYFVAGNTPSRSKVAYITSIAAGSPTIVPITTAESGGGLQNFIRLLENWNSRNLKIFGGFIQNTKSFFGTAPFSATAPYVDSSNPSNSSDIQTLFINPVDNTRAIQPLSKFKQVYQSETGQRIPFLAPPNRLWGFDVGLLTQAADRFAERFAAPIPGANEFLREVDGNDRWVKALLCSAQPGDPTEINAAGSPVNPGISAKLGTIPTKYTAYALGADKPQTCDPLLYN